MKRTDVINLLIKKYKYKSYLEIGVQDPTSNFDKINISHKVSVDPHPRGNVTFKGTSDDYFLSIDNEVKFDIIFIDGLHQSDQVIKDIENSLNHLSTGGTIVCHDCLPTSEIMQSYTDNGGEWTGDVWKAIKNIRIKYDNLIISTVDTDYGCGIIQRGVSNKYIPNETEHDNYEYYVKNRNDMLNVISVNEFMQWLGIDKYSVVIPTLWKSKRIHTLLDDLLKCNEVGEIILIDNGNKFFEYYKPSDKLRVIPVDENIYVNPAWNLGIEHSKNNLIALCNDDITFDTRIFRVMNESILDKMGIVGMGQENYKSDCNEDDMYVEEWKPGIDDMGWGCLIFLQKNNWVDIPENIKIWYGDNFIKDKNPTPKAVLRNFKVQTEMSTTSDEPQWDSIKQMDYINFMNLK